MGQSNDWTAKKSMVNKARSAGLSKPLVGAGIGAAIGGTAGFLAGTYNLSQDEVTIASETRELTRPELIGADYDPEDTYATYYTDSDGNMQTQWHTDPADWDPIIRNNPTGYTATEKVIKNSNWLGPVSGTLIGLGVGAVTGALVTSLTRLVDDPVASWGRTPKKPETEKAEKLANTANHAPLAGAAIGTVIGAAAGAYAGHVAAGKNVVLDQVVTEPIYETRNLGYIPRVSQKRTIPRNLFHRGYKIYYDELPDNRWGTPHFSDRGQAINRRYFTGEYQDVRRVENSHWLTPAKGAAIGAGLGAVTGLATGVASGILMKMAAGEQAPSPYS